MSMVINLADRRRHNANDRRRTELREEINAILSIGEPRPPAPVDPQFEKDWQAGLDALRAKREREDSRDFLKDFD